VVAYGLLKPRNEPRYQGRDLSDWLEEYSASGRRDWDRDAEIAVRNIGTNALPYLVKWATYKTPAWRTSLGKKLPAFITAGEDWFGGNDLWRSHRAWMGLRILGTNAVSVVPELLQTFEFTQRPTEWGVISDVLVNLGEDAAPALKAGLANPNLPGRDHFIYVLSAMTYRYGTNICLPILVEALDHEDLQVRCAATNMINRYWFSQTNMLVH
jgi:hypothetical protein